MLFSDLLPAAPYSSDLEVDALNPPSTADFVRAQVDQVMSTNPATLLVRSARREASYRPEIASDAQLFDPNAPGAPNPNYVGGQLLDPEIANEWYGIKDPRTGGWALRWDRPIHPQEAQELHQLKRQELARQRVMQNYQGGLLGHAAGIAGGLVASLTDPINIATAFIPVLGPARYARWLEQATSASGRAVVRFGTGAIEAGVGTAATEALVYPLARSEQQDYTMADSLMSIAFGSVLGGGLHAGFGLVGDRITGWSKIIDRSPQETKETLLRGAIAARMEDRPPRPDLLLREYLNSTAFRFTDDPTLSVPTIRGLPDTPVAEISRQDIIEGLRESHPDLVNRVDTAMAEVERLQNDIAALEAKPGLFSEAPKLDPDTQARLDYAKERLSDPRASKADKTAARREIDAIQESTQLPRDYERLLTALDDATERWQRAEDDVSKAVTTMQAKLTEQAASVGPNRMNAEIAAIRSPEGRAQFKRDLDAYVQEQTHPKMFNDPDDERSFNAIENRLARERHVQLTEDRLGGKTRIDALRQEIADLVKDLDNRVALGEISPEERAWITEAEQMVTAAEDNARFLELAASCVAGRR